jgi:hypothetical protein
MKIELTITRESNGVLGSYYRISAWQGEAYLGDEIYAGYTRAQAKEMALDTLEQEGGLGLYRGIIVGK